MKADNLNRRLAVLESKCPDIDRQDNRSILAMLTDEELYRLEDVCLRTDEWQLPLTEEEVLFIEDLRRKYAWPEPR